MITLHSLKSTNRKKNTRVGRGIAAGQGKTAGRGTKGQNSRTGKGIRIILPNLPKLRGFKSHFKKPVTINWRRVQNKFKAGEKITLKKLLDLGIIEKGQKFKIVGREKDTKTSNPSN